jgi:hypothetical protein
VSNTTYRLKPGQGLVEIVTESLFEIINLANGKTVAGNVTHIPSVRDRAIDFGMSEMLLTDDAALDDTLAALGFDPETGEMNPAPLLLAALERLQSMPNDPRAHRKALDAIAIAKGGAA